MSSGQGLCQCGLLGVGACTSCGTYVCDRHRLRFADDGMLLAHVLPPGDWSYNQTLFFGGAAQRLNRLLCLPCAHSRLISDAPPASRMPIDPQQMVGVLSSRDGWREYAPRVWQEANQRLRELFIGDDAIRRIVCTTAHAKLRGQATVRVFALFEVVIGVDNLGYDGLQSDRTKPVRWWQVSATGELSVRQIEDEQREVRGWFGRPRTVNHQVEVSHPLDPAKSGVFERIWAAVKWDNVMPIGPTRDVIQSRGS